MKLFMSGRKRDTTRHIPTECGGLEGRVGVTYAGGDEINANFSTEKDRYTIRFGLSEMARMILTFPIGSLTKELTDDEAAQWIKLTKKLVNKK